MYAPQLCTNCLAEAADYIKSDREAAVIDPWGGYRSMTAISLMKQKGFDSLVNVQDGFTGLLKAGLEMVTEEVFA